MLDRVRDGLADYIRKNKLEKPVIVGHSLGGFVALALAAKYPNLPGKLVIVDAYPFFGGLSDPEITPAKARENVAQMRQYMGAQTQDMYERYVKSGVATRMMVTKDSDFERIVAWGLASDRTAVTDAMCELFAADLRDDLANIKSPHAGPGHLDRLQPVHRPPADRSQSPAPVRQAGRRGDPDHRHRAPLHNVG